MAHKWSKIFPWFPGKEAAQVLKPAPVPPPSPGDDPDTSPTVTLEEDDLAKPLSFMSPLERVRANKR